MAEPDVKTIKTASSISTKIIGASQYFFLSLRNSHKSFNTSILLDSYSQVLYHVSHIYHLDTSKGPREFNITASNEVSMIELPEIYCKFHTFDKIL